MPQTETWPHLPAAVRDHLVERMHDRNISLHDLNNSDFAWRLSRTF